MRTTHNNVRDLMECNILIYAEDQKKLWEYREIFYRLNEKVSWKLELTLARKIETVWNIIELLSGKIDIFISDVELDEDLIKDLELQLWQNSYHIIIRKQYEYVDLYRINKNMKCINHWKHSRDDLGEKMVHVISKMRKTYCT